MKLCDIQIEGIINSVNGTYTPGPHERAHITKCLLDTVLALATEVQESRTRIAKLEAALKPFAEVADEHGGGYADYDSAFVVVKWLRLAREALETTP